MEQGFQLDLVGGIGVALLGLAVGVLSGLFGVGGGFLLTPFLNVFFGIPYNLAVGTGLAQMSVMSWVGTRQHMRLGHVDRKLGLAMLAGSFFGAETGVRVQHVLRRVGEIEVARGSTSGFDLCMAFLFVVLLVTTGWAMIVETGRTRRRAGVPRVAGAIPGSFSRGEEAAALDAGGPQPAASGCDAGDGEISGTYEPRPSAFSRWLGTVRARPCFVLASDRGRELSVWVPLGIGFTVAILTGLLGVGGGFVNMPVLIYVLNMPTVIAIGTSSLVTSAVSLYSGLRYVMQDMVIWPVVGLLLVGSVLGVRTGAKLSHQLPKDRLRRYFAYSLLATAAIVVADAARKVLI